MAGGIATTFNISKKTYKADKDLARYKAQEVFQRHVKASRMDFDSFVAYSRSQIPAEKDKKWWEKKVAKGFDAIREIPATC